MKERLIRSLQNLNYEVVTDTENIDSEKESDFALSIPDQNNHLNLRFREGGGMVSESSLLRAPPRITELIKKKRPKRKNRRNPSGQEAASGRRQEFIMAIETRTVFPRRLQDFRRFQTMMPQIFLYGNIYDCHYFPVNYRQAEKPEDLKWARFNNTRQLLMKYLREEGYELICGYDMVDLLDGPYPSELHDDRNPMGSKNQKSYGIRKAILHEERPPFDVRVRSLIVGRDEIYLSGIPRRTDLDSLRRDLKRAGIDI